MSLRAGQKAHCAGTRLARGGGMLLALTVLAADVPSASAQPTDPQQRTPAELSQMSLEQLVELPIDSVFSASMYLQKVTEAPSVGDDHHRRRHSSSATARWPTFCGASAASTSPTTATTAILGVRGFSRPGDYNARVLLLDRRPPPQRQHLRQRADRHGVPARRRADRADRNHPRPELVAVRHERLLWGHQRHHQARRAAEGVRVSARAGELRHAQRPCSATGSAFHSGARAAALGLGVSTATASGSSSSRSSTARTPTTGSPRTPTRDEFAKLFGRSRSAISRSRGCTARGTRSFPTASFGTVFNDPRSRDDRDPGVPRRAVRRAARDAVAARLRASTTTATSTTATTSSSTPDERPVARSSTRTLRAATGGARRSKPADEARADAQAGGRRRIPRQLPAGPVQLRRRALLQYLDDRRDSTNWALYRAGRDHRCTESCLLNLGLRHDHYDTFGGTTNPAGRPDLQPARRRPRSSCSMARRSAPRTPTSCSGSRATSRRPTRLLQPGDEPDRRSRARAVSRQPPARRARRGSTTNQRSDHAADRSDDDLLVYNNVDAIEAQRPRAGSRGQVAYGLKAGQLHLSAQPQRVTGLPSDELARAPRQFNLIGAARRTLAWRASSSSM